MLPVASDSLAGGRAVEEGRQVKGRCIFLVSTLRSGSLCPSCVGPKVFPASSPESLNTQRKTLLGARGCACFVERPRV